MITTILLGVAGPVIAALTVAVVLLWDALDQRCRERDQARRERDIATCKAADLRVERDTAVAEVSRLLGNQEQTQPLPAWMEFLNPTAAHDRAVCDALEQQFQDGAS